VFPPLVELDSTDDDDASTDDARVVALARRSTRANAREPRARRIVVVEGDVARDEATVVSDAPTRARVIARALNDARAVFLATGARSGTTRSRTRANIARWCAESRRTRRRLERAIGESSRVEAVERRARTATALPLL
jgi:aminoglycoside phosphotransferase (APT) family kinase protein